MCIRDSLKIYLDRAVAFLQGMGCNTFNHFLKILAMAGVQPLIQQFVAEIYDEEADLPEKGDDGLPIASKSADTLTIASGSATEEQDRIKKHLSYEVACFVFYALLDSARDRMQYWLFQYLYSASTDPSGPTSAAPGSVLNVPGATDVGRAGQEAIKSMRIYDTTLGETGELVRLVEIQPVRWDRSMQTPSPEGPSLPTTVGKDLPRTDPKPFEPVIAVLVSPKDGAPAKLCFLTQEWYLDVNPAKAAQAIPPLEEGLQIPDEVIFSLGVWRSLPGHVQVWPRRSDPSLVPKFQKTVEDPFPAAVYFGPATLWGVDPKDPVLNYLDQGLQVRVGGGGQSRVI